MDEQPTLNLHFGLAAAAGLLPQNYLQQQQLQLQHQQQIQLQQQQFHLQQQQLQVWTRY